MTEHSSPVRGRHPSFLRIGHARRRRPARVPRNPATPSVLGSDDTCFRREMRGQAIGTLGYVGNSGRAMSERRDLRVLLVEDEAIIAIMLEDMLADLGCEVV